MIKITQEFETESEAKRALNSKNYFSALWEIEQHIHNTIKHKEFDSDGEYAVYESIENKINDIMVSNNVNLMESE